MAPGVTAVTIVTKAHRDKRERSERIQREFRERTGRRQGEDREKTGREQGEQRAHRDNAENALRPP